MAADTAKVLSVSQITEMVKDTLEGEMSLRSVYVRGEISDFTSKPGRFGSNFLYFTLKEKDIRLSCVMFEGTDELDFKPKNGMTIVCEGMITVYPPFGRYQLKCYSMSESGAGESAAALERLKARLLGEGLFSQKRELPKFPKKIAVITSSTGAAVRDIETVISRRYPVTELCVIPATVQGQYAEASLVEGMKKAQNVGADLIIFGRGGGSSEDLSCFNSEALARAIFASKIPTISAVGHEIDTTIADLAADKRAATPSAAAELAVPDISELKNQIAALKNRSAAAMSRKLSKCVGDLLLLEREIQLRSPKARIANWQSRLNNIEMRTSNVIRRKLEKNERDLMIAAQTISNLNPLAVLSRGYAIAKKDSKAIKNAKELRVGDVIDIKLDSGGVSAEVIRIEE